MKFYQNSIVKKIICLLLIGMCCMSFITAQTSTTTTTTSGSGGTIDAFSSLKKVFGTIYAFFTSTYMLVICTIGIIIIGIQMITNKGEPVVMKKLVPWMAAVIIIGSASAITGLFFKPTTEIQNLTDGKTHVLQGWN